MIDKELWMTVMQRFDLTDHVILVTAPRLLEQTVGD
jgi:hypothetical protein